jgi:hypothetical protein
LITDFTPSIAAPTFFLCRQLGWIGEDVLKATGDRPDLVGRRHAGERSERQAARVLGDLEPIDPLEQVFDGFTGLREHRAFFNQPRDDTLNQRDLGVFEALKAPAVELQAEHVVASGKAGLDHFEDT